ncbi:MAG: hypothetical protein ACUVUU_00990 [bacterium]
MHGINWKSAILGLSRIDRRYIYLAILVCVAIPLITGVKMTMGITSPVRSLYDAIERLEPGSYVWLATDYDPGSMPELYPMNTSFVQHLFSKDAKIICASLWPAGTPLAQRIFDELAPSYGKTYGIDYVNLGFKEGREAVMISVAEDLKKTFPSDYLGTSVDSLPMLSGITSLRNVKMLICVSAGYPGIKEWVQQIATRYNIMIGGGVTAVSAPEMYPYIQSGQLVGLLAGMKGAAEYELLLNKPALGTAGMVAQSYVHLMIVVFIIFANVAFILEKGKK